jgi:TolA-binding protein
MEVFMKRATLALVTVLSLGPFGWSGEAMPAQTLSSYLDQMQVKLDHAAQRANQPSSSGSSVVGLRGSKQEPISKQLYWKGKTGPVPVTPEEVKMFRTAIEQAKAGQKDVAITTLKAFMDKYPKSGLIGDAKDTLKLLASAPAPSPAKS